LKKSNNKTVSYDTVYKYWQPTWDSNPDYLRQRDITVFLPLYVTIAANALWSGLCFYHIILWGWRRSPTQHYVITCS